MRRVVINPVTLNLIYILILICNQFKKRGGATLGLDDFYIKDCALSSIALGIKAKDLHELYDSLHIVHPTSIYYHFWGARLRTNYEKREYHNDFAMWACHSLQDQTLAERLSIIDPTDFEDTESLRQAVIKTIRPRLGEFEGLKSGISKEPFYFAQAKIIVFDTDYRVKHPQEFIQILPKLSSSSIYYHFIDAYRRPPLGMDDFSAWLEAFNGKYSGLVQKLLGIDFYFLTLANLQASLEELFMSYFLANPEVASDE